jgi:hypothetical protein
MKKMMTLMLGAALAIGSVALYAQGDKKSEPTKKSTKSNKKSTKKSEDKK